MAIKSSVDYRALKKILSKYFTFTFKNPRKNKDFTPQQKSSITRKYQKIAHYLNSHHEIDKTEVSWVPYPKHSKLPNVDGVRTNKGLIYKFPNAEILKSKKEKGKFLIVINPKVKKGLELVQKRRDVFIPFPKKILHNPQAIEIFVNTMVDKYKPADVQWGYRDTRSRSIFDIAKLSLYIQTKDDNEFSEMREYAEFAIKKSKNLLSTDKEKFKRAADKLKKSDFYQMLDFVEQQDLWAAINYQRNSRREDFTYNGVFFIYFL